MGKRTQERIKQLNQIGEEDIFERIETGMPVRHMIKSMELGWATFYKWVDSEPGRRDRYQRTLNNAGHFYASRAVQTAQSADADNVNVARLQVDTDKWIASKYNQIYDARPKQVDVAIRVEDLHAQAAALIAQEVEREVIDLSLGDDIQDADVIDDTSGGDV
jgi:hypothetical protein